MYTCCRPLRYCNLNNIKLLGGHVVKEVIWGKETGDLENDQYISIGLDSNEPRHVYIKFCNIGHMCVYHFIIKDIDDYEEFKIHLTYLIEDCENVYDAEEMFNASDSFIYEYLDDYPEPKQELRTEEEIYEYMSEACDRVWLVRKQDLFCNMLMGIKSIDADILDGCNKAIDEVCQRYNIDFKEIITDWEYGYWSGILAALRWVVGDDKDSLDT